MGVDPTLGALALGQALSVGTLLEAALAPEKDKNTFYLTIPKKSELKDVRDEMILPAPCCVILWDTNCVFTAWQR